MKLHAITSPDGSPAYPKVRRIDVSDLKYALDKGREDFLTMPSSLFFLALIYPIVGIGLVAGSPLPLIFPPRRPSSTMRIFSSAENCRRVARRISFTTFSAGSFAGADFCLIFAP